MSKSIMQPSEPKQCYLCGRQFGIEEHHIWGGVANRRVSEANGFWVFLCAECHRGKKGAQYEKDLNLLLKRECQKQYEKTHTREEFMALIGKSYL